MTPDRHHPEVCPHCAHELYGGEQKFESRRRFLKQSAALVVAGAAGSAVPGFLVRSALALKAQSQTPGMVNSALGSAAAANPTILVVLGLFGGNDGLNTVIPHTDPLYYQNRPRIAIPDTESLKLPDTGMAFNPRLSRLYQRYLSRQVAVVQGVTYPNPNLSHFESTTIWESASLSQTAAGGWLGRTLERVPNILQQPLYAVNTGSNLPEALFTDMVSVPSFYGLHDFGFLNDWHYQDDNTFKKDALVKLAENTPTGRPYDLLLRNVTLQAMATAADLQSKTKDYNSPVVYPNSGLGNKLKTIAQMIYGNLGTRIFYLSTGGYDTHSDQRQDQDQLHDTMDQALEAFMTDLQSMNRQGDVAIMTFSEFGRRVSDNAGGGTDHGTASCLFVVGGRVKGGLYGPNPNLSDLDSTGNLKLAIDFRTIYATMLQNWLGLPAADVQAVLGPEFAGLDLFTDKVTTINTPRARLPLLPNAASG